MKNSDPATQAGLSSLRDEEWRRIPSFPSYEASSLGRIRKSASGRVLSPGQSSANYLKVALFSEDGSRADKTLHRLPLEAFAGPCPAGHVCAHLNGDPRDNRAENLMWVSRSDNERQKPKLLSPDDERRVRELRGQVSQKESARQFGVNARTIQRVQAGASSPKASIPVAECGKARLMAARDALLAEARAKEGQIAGIDLAISIVNGLQRNEPPPFDNPLRCRHCASTDLVTKPVTIWEPGPYGNKVRVDEWFERSCRQCKATYKETIAEAVARAMR